MVFQFAFFNLQSAIYNSAGMLTLLERVTIFCFAASYGLALLLELWHLLRPRPIWRYLGTACGAAGIFAHALYLAVQQPSLVSPTGSLLFLALILAVFYLYGALHHHLQAWGLFVLPLVLALVGLAVALRAPQTTQEVAAFWDRFWGMTHGVLLLLAAVGVCVGFIASLMYLVQMYRLRVKLPPSKGMRLLSLERLETMNRRAILTAFPLLTAGVAVGVVLQLHHGLPFEDWDSPKILSTLIVWIAFALLVYLRYGIHARGRQVALLTMLAFALLIVALIAPGHPPGVTP
jgi:ABC-type uncharacterized transport system permease subunit